jgi:hypothetical protein
MAQISVEIIRLPGSLLRGDLHGPVKVFHRPMDEDALEDFRLGQPDGPMVLSILQRQQRSAQKRGVCKGGIVFRQGAEGDRGAMLPRNFLPGQMQSDQQFTAVSCLW